MTRAAFVTLALCVMPLGAAAEPNLRTRGRIRRLAPDETIFVGGGGS